VSGRRNRGSDVGLLSEEYDPRHGRLVGNTPQAFSHFALIQTALNIEDHAVHHRRRMHGTPAMTRKG
jgi:GH15 family glucan-1,4-alpha-glucosidase